MQGNNVSPAANGNGVPPSPSQGSSVTEDLSNYDLPALSPTSKVWGNYGYGLYVQQEPVRARMCGFGDKVKENPRGTAEEADPCCRTEDLSHHP